MSDLLLHKSTAQSIKAVIARPPHAILVAGQLGAGKLTLALYVAAKLLQVELAELDNYPHFFDLKRSEKSKEISIDEVRELISKLKLRTPGKNYIRRIAIIENAEAMSHAAQNSLLKLLEEPPDDTVIILTSINPSALLPTIVSRCRILEIHPVTLEQSHDFFAEKTTKQQITSAWHLSQGGVGLMQALLTDADHPLKKSVELFKDFLKQDKYLRLDTVEKVSKDKHDFNNFLEAGSRVLKALQSDAANHKNLTLTRRITTARQVIYKAMQQLNASTSPRLVSLNLALNLTI